MNDETKVYSTFCKDRFSRIEKGNAATLKEVKEINTKLDTKLDNHEIRLDRIEQKNKSLFKLIWVMISTLAGAMASIVVFVVRNWFWGK